VKTEKSIDGALLIDPVRTLTQICFFPFQATSNKQEARSKKQQGGGTKASTPQQPRPLSLHTHAHTHAHAHAHVHFAANSFFS